MIVRDINGLSLPPCRCGDWLRHWLNFSGQPLPKICPRDMCHEPPEIAILVQRNDPKDHSWYVLPMCRRHQDETGDMVVSDIVALVPVDACESCVDDTPHPITTPSEVAALDDFLWRVLWQPAGLPRDVRQRFKVEGESVELAVRRSGCLVGGLSATWTAPDEIELRHLAIHPEIQGQGLGRRLVDALVSRVAHGRCRRIRTIAHNTSAEFFRRLGFRSAQESHPTPPVFRTYGISFQMMEIDL